MRKASSGARPERAKEAAPLALYCRNLEADFALVDIIGAPVGDDSPPARLEHLYVEQAASTQAVGEEATPDPGLPPVADVIRDNRVLVLLGEPGGGKSTLLQWAAWQFAVAGLGRMSAGGWPQRLGFTPDEPAVALPFILRELPVRAGVTWDDLWKAFLAHTRQRPLTDESLRPLLESGRAVFLVDGLDEVGPPAARRSLRNALLDGLRRHSSCRWVLTSRVVGYDEVPFHVEPSREQWTAALPEAAPVCPVYHLAPFDDAQVREFAGKWYVTRAASDAEAARKAEDLCAAVFRDEGTTSLARVPFLLTLMAAVHRNNVTLPDGRARLYRLITEAYVEKREASKKLALARFPASDQLACLARVGIEMQLRRAAGEAARRSGPPGGATALLAPAADVAGWLASAAGGDAERAAAFLDHLGRRTGLLLPRGEGQYSFIHLSFLEFFAGLFLRQQVTSRAWAVGPEEKVPEVARRGALRGHAADARWHVPLVFLCELLATDGRRDYLEEDLLPALFGPGFRFVDGHEREGVRRGLLLARLVSDRHAGWEERDGWGDMLRLQALEACCRAEVQYQEPIKERYAGGPPIAQALLANEEGRSKVIGLLVEKAVAAQLRDFTLQGTGLVDLSPLSRFNDLQCLDLRRTKVTDLRPLTELHDLRTLLLDHTPVSDIGPIAKLDRLRRLSLIKASVADLRPLERLVGLEELSLSSEFVTDIRSLAGLRSLRYLYLGHGSRLDDQVERLQIELPNCKIVPHAYRTKVASAPDA